MMWTLLFVMSTAFAEEPSGPPAEPPRALAADPMVPALDLPEIASTLRKNGVPADEVNASLDAALAAGLSAAETREALHAVQEAMKRYGRIDGLDTFLQSKLQDGVRGDALAQAITDEFAKDGMGRPAASQQGQAGQGQPGQGQEPAQGEPGQGQPGKKPPLAGGPGGAGPDGGAWPPPGGKQPPRQEQP